MTEPARSLTAVPTSRVVDLADFRRRKEDQKKQAEARARWAVAAALPQPCWVPVYVWAPVLYWPVMG